MKVSTYKLIASNGKPIRNATKVTFEDGREIKFVELLSKKEAIRQVEKQIPHFKEIAKTFAEAWDD